LSEQRWIGSGCCEHPSESQLKKTVML
jgi:hypothetical protein